MYYSENPAGLPAGTGTRNYKRSAALLADARRSLLGNTRAAVWSFALYLFLGMFLYRLPSSFVFDNAALSLVLQLFAQFVVTVFLSLFGIGLSSVFLCLQYGQSASIRNLFACFRENPDNAVKVRCFVTGGELLTALPFQLLLYFTPQGALWNRLPLVIAAGLLCAGLYLAWHINFVMTNYVILDYPSLQPMEILRTAHAMMRGNRMRYFRMLLRLFPIHLLGLFSLGLTNIWTGCYQFAASAAFYKDLVTRLSDEAGAAR